jgi:hypothetical protein
MASEVGTATGEALTLGRCLSEGEAPMLASPTK